MKIKNGCRVELEYAILDDRQETVESSAEAGPILYVHGTGDLPPVLEDALEGRSVGEELDVPLAPGEAFGPYDPGGLVSVPRHEFPEDAEIVPGDWIELVLEDSEENESAEARVVEVRPDAVVLDLNHPLADQSVTFRVSVISVEED